MQTELLLKYDPHLVEFFSMSTKHKDFDLKLFDYVRKQDRQKTLNLLTKESRKLYRLHREVCTCLHLKKGFIRFKLSKKGILYAKTFIEHNIEHELLRFFHSRFPIFYVIIENKNKCFCVNNKGEINIISKPLSKVINNLEEELPDNNLLIDLDFEENIWETYYDSQFIKERRNLKLMQKMMPKKYRDKGMAETNISLRTRKLNEFID